MHDAELIDAYKKAPNNKLFEEIYLRYAHLALATCMKYLKNEQDAEDCTMQLFEHLPNRLRKHEIGFFSSWMYRVTVNECLQFLRIRKKNTSDIEHLEFTFEEDEDENESLREIQLEKLILYLDDLKADQRLCVEQFYLKKQSYQQIVDQSGLSLGQVKSAIQNGKRNLRLRFLEHEKDNR